MAIPVELTEAQFQTFIEPHLSRANRGYVYKIPRYMLFNYLLHVLYTGCQWPALQASIDLDDRGEPELSFRAVHYHLRKWSRESSSSRVFENSVRTLLPDLDISELNLDGATGKKGANQSPIKVEKRAKLAIFSRSRINKVSS